MDLTPVKTSRLVILQYKQKLYSVDLHSLDLTLHRVSYPSGSLLAVCDEEQYAVINQKQAEIMNVCTGVVQEILADPPIALVHAAVVCSQTAFFAFCTNSRLFKFDFQMREWSTSSCSIEKVPSVWCRIGSNQVLMLYAHTLWITNRYSLTSEEAVEGKLYDLRSSEVRTFSLRLDLLGRFGCVQVREGEVLIFGGYEQLRGNNSVLMDDNRDLYLLDLIHLQVTKVGVLSRALEEPSIPGVPVLWNDSVYFQSGRQIVQIELDSYQSFFTSIDSLYFRNKLQFIWIIERLKSRPQWKVSLLSLGLVREIARFLTAYEPN